MCSKVAQIFFTTSGKSSNHLLQFDFSSGSRHVVYKAQSKYLYLVPKLRYPYQSRSWPSSRYPVTTSELPLLLFWTGAPVTGTFLLLNLLWDPEAPVVRLFLLLNRFFLRFFAFWSCSTGIKAKTFIFCMEVHLDTNTQ